MTLLALGFFGGVVLTAVAVLIPGRLLSIPETRADINDGDINDGDTPDGDTPDSDAGTPEQATMLDGLPQVHPAIVLVLGAIAVAALPRKFGPWLFVVVSALAGLATLGLVDGTTWHYDFYGFDLTPLRVDGLSLAFAYVFAIALLAGGIFGMATMGTLERTSALVYAASAFGVVFAGDVVTLFFFWELKVSASTLLVFARRTAASSAAALRYLFVNLAGGIVLLAGIVWWVIDTGSVAFGNFGLNGGATILILIGFCVAAAAVPLHAWMPDAYPASTIAGTVFLAAFTSKAAVYALARGFPGTSVADLGGCGHGAVRRGVRPQRQRHPPGAGVFIGVARWLHAGRHRGGHRDGTQWCGGPCVRPHCVQGSVAHGRRCGAVVHRPQPPHPARWFGPRHAVGGWAVPSGGGVDRVRSPVQRLRHQGDGHPGHRGGRVPHRLLASQAGQCGDVVRGGVPPAVVHLVRQAGCRRQHQRQHQHQHHGIATGAAVLTRKVTPSMYVAMGALAVVNIAIGIAPNLVYDVLPFAVDYSPFKTYRVVNAVALAAGAAVAFWLVRRWLAGRPVRVVDTDWVYRDLPRHLAPAVGRLRMPEVHMKLPTAPGTPVWASTLWVSGAVVIVTFVVVLAIGVTS